jgi:hypothetical protein
MVDPIPGPIQQDAKEVPMADDVEKREISEAELRKVEEAAAAKQLRHHLDEYVAIILGVGAVLILWFLQIMGVY